MFRFLFILFVSVLSHHCYAQNDTIETVILEFQQFKYRDTSYKIDYRNKQLTCTMLGIKAIKDTLFHNTYTFNDTTFQKLKSELNVAIPKSTIQKGENAMDGGGFTIQYFGQNGISYKMIITNPMLDSSRYQPELKKITAFFDFAYSIVKDSAGITVLDHSYRPYFTGLPIRKISEVPLEYKIWGSISGAFDDNPELVSFLDALPKNRCVIIDGTTNLSYASLAEIVKSYSSQYSNLYFLNNDYLDALHKDLITVRKTIHQSQKRNKKLNNSIAYTLYTSDPAGMDKWLDQGYYTAKKPIQELRKNCR